MVNKLIITILSLILLPSITARGQAPHTDIVQSKSTAFQPFQQPPAPQLAGLWVNVNTGVFWISGLPITVATARVSVHPNTTNYIYLDMILGVIAVNTTGFPSTSIYPIAQATTNATFVTGLFDVRPDIIGGGGGGGFTPGGDISGSSISQIVSGILNSPLPVLSSGYLHFNGSAWVFDTPAGSGTITGVTAGTGLSGGGNSGGVTLSVSNPLPSGVIAGSICVSNGINLPCAYQTKSSKDVRDFGVICGIGIDNTTALQSAINGTPNFSELDIPLGCRIEVSSTINVHTVQGLWIKAKGGQHPGVLSQLMPSIVWKGADHGGPVFDINCASWMIWDGFAIFLQDGISGNNADIGLDIRQNSCSSITTHNVYQNMAFESEGANSSRIMIRIGAGAFSGNIEQQWFLNSTMLGDMGLGTFSTTQGIGLSQIGQEPIDTVWEGGSVSGLTTGFNVTAFNITISHTIGGSYTDINCSASCNSHDNRWENSVLPWIISTGANVITEKDDISSLTTTNPIFTLPDGGANVVFVMRDFSAGGVNLSTTFNAITTPMTGGSLTIEGQNRLPDVPIWSTYCNTGCTVNALGTVNLIGSSVPSPSTLHGIGLNLQSNQSGVGGLQAISPVINLIASYHAPINDRFSLLNTTGGLAWVHSGSAPLGPAGFGFPFSSLATIALPTPTINSVTPVGTPGSTTYTYKLVYHAENGTSSASAAVTTTTGNASLNNTNYNQIQWFPDPGVTSFDIYRTAGGGTQGKIGTVLPGGNNGTNFTFFFKDTGLTGDASVAPSTNTTGGLFAGCTTIACGTFGASISASGQITSTISTGTAPLVIASTTPVANLSIGGNAATATNAAGLIGTPNITVGTVAAASVTASGAGSFATLADTTLSQGQPMVSGSGGALNNSTAYFYALKLPNAGATPDTHVNNCVAWILTYGGGTCDDRDDIATQTFTHPIQFGHLLAPAVATASGGSLTSGQPAWFAITLCSPNGSAPQGNCPGGAHETSPSEENTSCAPSGGNLSCTVTSPDNTATNGFFGSATTYNVYGVQAASPTHWTELFCAGSNTAIGSPVTISAACAGSVFSATQKSGYATEFLLPLYGTWNCNITTGTTVSCATFYNYASVHGPSIGIGNRFAIFNTGTTSVYALCSTPQTPVLSTTIINLAGFACMNNQSGGGTMASGSACVWQNTSDTFRVDNVGCVDVSNGDFSTWTWGTGAGTSLFNYHGSGQATAGAGSCKIGNSGGFSNTGTYYFGWSCPAAGTNANNLNIFNGFGEFGIFGLYMEKDSTDTTTNMIDVNASGGGAFFAIANGAATPNSVNPIFTFETGSKPGAYGIYGVSTNKVLMPIVSDISAGAAQSYFGHPTSNAISYMQEPFVNGVGRAEFMDSPSIMISDDFLTGSLTAPGIGNLNWAMQGSAACGTAAQPASVLPNLGLFEVTTGASSGNTCGITFATAGALGALGNAGGWDMTWVFKVPVTTNAGAYVGVSDSLTTVPANFFGFAFDTANAATFRLCTVVASATTCDTTTFTADTNFHRLHMWSQANNAATAILQFDGNAPITMCVSGCTTNATTLPTTAMTPIAQAVTRTTSAQQLILDYFAFRYTVAR